MVSTKGQVVLPLPLRRELGISRGQRLAIAVRGGAIELRPLRRLSQMGGIIKGVRIDSQEHVHRLRKEWEEGK